MNKKYNIIYNSHYPWSDIMSRYTNLAIALSNSEYVNELVFLEPLKHIGDISNIRNAFHQITRIGMYRKVKSTPFSMYSAISPVPFRHKSSYAQKLENHWEECALEKIMKLIPNENKIVLLQGPSDFTLKMIRKFKKEGFLTIFDWGDFYEKHVAPPDVQKKIVGLCRQMTFAADCVLCVSKAIQKIALSENNNSFILANAIPQHIISNKIGEPRDLQDRITKAVICYYGLINPIKLDYALIKEIAIRKPEWKFIFIGPQNDPLNMKSTLKANNIIILPAMDGRLLHNYLLENADICMIPYNSEDKAIYYCSPLKLYESLGDGLPVVSTDTFDPGHARELISLGNTASEFIDTIQYELETDCLEKRKQRVEFAKKNTWKKRVEEIIHIIESIQQDT